MEKEETKEAKSVKSVTLKLTPEVYDRYKALEAEIDAPTVSLFMDTIIERVFSPIQINKENERKLEESEKIIEDLKEKLEVSERSYDDILVSLTSKKEEIERLENEKLESLNSALKQNDLPENSHVITFEPLNEKVIQYVAARETKSRTGQNWTIEDVINFYIDQWFIKGNPNGSLDNVPDRIINAIKKEFQIA